MTFSNQLVQRFPINTKGRDFIAGDIHGSLDAFQQALRAAGFDWASGDRLFLVGDLVDRGPQSHEMLGLLALPNVHAVRGNHEQMLIDYDEGLYDDACNYLANGGAWALALTKPELTAFADEFRSLPIAIELETPKGPIGIVHAECPLNDWGVFVSELEAPDGGSKRRDQLVMCAQWSRNRIESSNDAVVEGVRAVVVGHTPMRQSISLGNTLYIDTMGWRPNGFFTILDANTLQPAEAA